MKKWPQLWYSRIKLRPHQLLAQTMVVFSWYLCFKNSSSSMCCLLYWLTLIKAIQSLSFTWLIRELYGQTKKVEVILLVWAKMVLYAPQISSQIWLQLSSILTGLIKYKRAKREELISSCRKKAKIWGFRGVIVFLITLVLKISSILRELEQQKSLKKHHFRLLSISSELRHSKKLITTLSMQNREVNLKLSYPSNIMQSLPKKMSF